MQDQGKIPNSRAIGLLSGRRGIEREIYSHDRYLSVKNQREWSRLDMGRTCIVQKIVDDCRWFVRLGPPFSGLQTKTINYGDGNYFSFIDELQVGVRQEDRLPFTVRRWNGWNRTK